MVIVGERHCHQAAKSMPRGSRVLVARSRYNFPGRASPLRAAPQSRMSPIMAYGSSSYDFAEYIEWTTIAGGNGNRFINSEKQCQDIPPRFRLLRSSHLCQRRSTSSRIRSRSLPFPVISGITIGSLNFPENPLMPLPCSQAPVESLRPCPLLAALMMLPPLV